MRRNFVYIPAETSVSEALGIMRMARLRHAFVEREGQLLGVLSYRELQDREIERLGSSPLAAPPTAVVEEVMLEVPIAVTEDTPLRIAAARMTRFGVGCLAVVEADDRGPRLVGLVSERDLLRAAYPLL